MLQQKKAVVNLAIGFATGRKNFQRVLRTHILNWKESGLVDSRSVRLHLIIAYDLKYAKTRPSDFTNISRDLVAYLDSVRFIDQDILQQEMLSLAKQNVVLPREAESFFRGGYAGMRNSILYEAVKRKMDYLLFLDDDEYPLAVTRTRSSAIWSGQHVLKAHLREIAGADITHGYHCGYISPIPSIQFDDTLCEDQFHTFIGALSNDIVNWETVKHTMENGGVTYADKEVLIREEAEDVKEINHAKFISGSNLCINLTRPGRVNAFYNPPGARGEDTFLSTTLRERTVRKVPCYAFHDGFGAHQHLLYGVLPIQLKTVTADSLAVVTRFYRACMGWVRYKPLLLYITQRNNYERRIADMQRGLQQTIPAICTYFRNKEFVHIQEELESYHLDVQKHYREFQEYMNIWSKIREHAADAALAG